VCSETPLLRWVFLTRLCQVFAVRVAAEVFVEGEFKWLNR
jgi:hypothetical protein